MKSQVFLSVVQHQAHKGLTSFSELVDQYILPLITHLLSSPEKPNIPYLFSKIKKISTLFLMGNTFRNQLYVAASPQQLQAIKFKIIS